MRLWCLFSLRKRYDDEKLKEYYDNESIFLSELRERLKKRGIISFSCSRGGLKCQLSFQFRS